MTLQNGLLTPEAAYLWSETAHYSLEREFVRHEPKVYVGEGWPYALVHSGTSDTWDVLREVLKQVKPQEPGDLTACIVASLQPFLSNLHMVQRVLVASWERVPRLKLIATEPSGHHPPLYPVPIWSQMVNSNSEAIRREVAKGVTVESMVRVIRAQHSDSHLDGHWPLAGKVTRARVSREGVELVEVDDLPDPMACGGTVPQC